MSTDCNSHEFLWKADRAIPMWSGEWTPPECVAAGKTAEKMAAGTTKVMKFICVEITK